MAAALKVTPDAFLEACLPGASPEILSLKECITRLNAQDDEVRAILLLGETGVGKTYIANVIAMHRCWLNDSFLKTESEPVNSPQIAEQKQWYVRNRGSGILKASGDPYHEVPLPLLDGNMARAWLFGYEKGAFTDAKKPSPGFLGKENVTDVLLDEIGYASLDMQRALLQVIQSGDYYKLNSTKKETTEARLIFATNQDLEQLVRERTFQADLWWRLTDHVLYVPPLRERRPEINTIATQILASLNSQHIGGDGSAYLYLSQAELTWAENHDWHGNVRELEKTVQRWFFYRGTKSLKEVWTQIEPFVPRSQGPGLDCISLEPDKLRVYLASQLKKSLAGEIALPNPEELLTKLGQPTRDRAASVLAACIDDLRLPPADLMKLFNGYKLSSLRSWLSRHRS